MKDYSYEEMSRFMEMVREAMSNTAKDLYECKMLTYYEGQMSIIKILLHHMIELDGTADSVTATLKMMAHITEEAILGLL